MTESPGIAAPLPTAAVIPPNGVAPGAELLTPLIALRDALTFTATVVGPGADGAMLLRSAYGAFSFNAPQPLPAGTRVELRFQPGNPPSLAVLSVAEPEAPEPAAPPMRLDLGTTTAATVIAAGSDPTQALPLGTRLELRVVPPPTTGSSELTGQIVLGAGDETIVETPVGTLALDLRVGLSPGTTIAFARLGTVAGLPPGEPTPSQVHGWPALDQALAVLDQTAPTLAQQVRAVLTPQTPPALAGTLLFLMGALSRGNWPGPAVDHALAAAGEDRLKQRLGADLRELAEVSQDRATDPWRVLTLPLLSGTLVSPLRLYLPRQDEDGGTDPESGSRFVFEAELSRLGPLQLDGRVRGNRLDLVLRSHVALPSDVRQEAAALFRLSSAANGLHGDILFATTPEFVVAPLAALRRHVEMRA